MIIIAKTAIAAIIPAMTVLPYQAPSSMPRPLTGSAIVRIELPAPTLNPGLLSTPVTTAVFPALPIPRIPSRPIVPVYRPVASKENVAHPLAGILPGLDKQLGAAVRSEKKDEPREKLEQLFDGRRRPAEKPTVSESFTLPETDLEKEIGAY